MGSCYLTGAEIVVDGGGEIPSWLLAVNLRSNPLSESELESTRRYGLSSFATRAVGNTGTVLPVEYRGLHELFDAQDLEGASRQWKVGSDDLACFGPVEQLGRANVAAAPSDLNCGATGGSHVAYPVGLAAEGEWNQDLSVSDPGADGCDVFGARDSPHMVDPASHSKSRAAHHLQRDRIEHFGQGAS